MKTTLRFKETTMGTTEPVVVSLEGSHEQVDHLVASIREAIKKDKEKQVEHPWEHVWGRWEEI